MIELPTNLADIESLVRNQVPESIHLDYKASAALDSKKSDEIAKDVSAFANSDGGLLIYGVEEDKALHIPLQIDNGVDPKWNRERLEQIITSNISPRIEGIEIRQFSLPNKNCVFCVLVKKSFRGPHQASSNRYYKRYNFTSCPMEHYEVDDVRARAQTVPPSVVLDMKAPSETHLPFVLRNVGNLPARNLKFKLPNDVKWPGGVPPSQFIRGITFLAPGKVFEIYSHGPHKVFDWKETGVGLQFDIEVSYNLGFSDQRIVDVFHFDSADYRNTALFTTGSEKMDWHASEISRRLGDLVGVIERALHQRERVLGPSAQAVTLRAYSPMVGSITGFDSPARLRAIGRQIGRAEGLPCDSPG
jgi:hypothetical protein